MEDLNFNEFSQTDLIVIACVAFGSLVVHKLLEGIIIKINAEREPCKK